MFQKDANFFLKNYRKETEFTLIVFNQRLASQKTKNTY